MEPIRTTKTARLRTLKMYREELDQLVAFFQTACSNVTISDHKNRYDSLDEMKAHIGSNVTHLDIRGEAPGLHFLLNQKEVVSGSSSPTIFNELRTEEISDGAEILFLKVKEFLLEHQRPPVRWPFLIVTIVALSGVLSLGVTHHVEGSGSLRAPWGLLVCTIVLTISVAATLKIGNYLTLETRVNSPSFWKRHQEAFATHAVTTAIGGLVGWFVCHFLK